jgi:hypothetical protein
LNVIHIIVIDGDNGVLMCFYYSLLKGGNCFFPWNGLRMGAQSGKGIHKNFVEQYPYFQVPEIGSCGNGTRVTGNVTETPGH